MTVKFDVVVIGAGAAGLFCAAQAGQRGLKVLLIDHAEKVAEKIRISGGGRCNFTNRDLDVRAPERHFLSDNPRFCRSALSRYTPADFIALLDKHGIAWHEKHKGQLFCDRSADDLIQMLLGECDTGHVTRWQPCRVRAMRRVDTQVSADIHSASESNLEEENAHSQRGMCASSYEIDSDRGTITCPAVVIATGGLSIPKIGASDFGYQIAKQFGHQLVPLRPALVPLTFDESQWAPFVPLAGLSLPVKLETGEGKTKGQFDEDLLFTHRGLSGPAVLQISSYWKENTPIRIDLAPLAKVQEVLQQGKARSRKRIANELHSALPGLPTRLADTWTAQNPDWQRPINEASDKALTALATSLQRWQITPNGSEGYKKAEVTAGGVDTRELSSQTMESSKSPGLYFIGEVVDVTGWLGGYNFQWAWASAVACAAGLADRVKAKEGAD